MRWTSDSVLSTLGIRRWSLPLLCRDSQHARLYNPSKMTCILVQPVCMHLCRFTSPSATLFFFSAILFFPWMSYLCFPDFCYSQVLCPGSARSCPCNGRERRVSNHAAGRYQPHLPQDLVQVHGVFSYLFSCVEDVLVFFPSAGGVFLSDFINLGTIILPFLSLKEHVFGCFITAQCIPYKRC